MMVVILLFSITWRVDVSSFCDVTIGRSICGECRRHAGPCAHGVIGAITSALRRYLRLPRAMKARYRLQLPRLHLADPAYM